MSIRERPTTTRFVPRAPAVVAAIVAAGLLGSCAEPAYHPFVGGVPRLESNTFELTNGMRVVIHEDRRIPKVKVSISVEVGSADEPPGRGGFAHLFEHLMFMGTKAAPNFDVVMEQVGASNNAYTDFDETVYYESGPSSSLPTLLWLEADRFANIPTYMTAEKVNLQRDVVLNEMRQNVLDEPGASANEASNEALFPARHPYRRPVIGSIADLQAAKTEDVVDFFAKYYAPSNLTMVIAGDVDTRDTIRMVKRLFGPIKNRSVPDKPRDDVKRTCSPCRSTQKFVDAVANPRVNIIWATSNQRVNGSISNPDLELAASMLADVDLNALQQQLVKKQKVATSVSAYYSPKALAGFFQISAEAAEGVTAEKLQKALEVEIAEVAKNGFTDAEFDAVRDGENTAIEEAFEEVEGRVDLIRTTLAYYGRADRVTAYETRLDDSSPESAQATFAGMVAASTQVTQVVTPGPRGDYPAVLKNSSGKPSAKLRPAPPQLIVSRPRDGEPTAVTVPTPAVRTLRNGIVVRYFRRADAPRLRLLIRVRGGGERDPNGKEGLANLVGQTMTRGAGGRDSAAYSEALSDAATDLSVSGDVGGYSVSASAPTNEAATALTLVNDALRKPRFDENEVALAIEENIAGLEAAQQDPTALAQRAIAGAFYTPEHPYGRYMTLESVRNISPDDLRAEHRAVFQPQNADVVAAGSLPVDRFVELLEASFAGWDNTSAPTEKFVDVRPKRAKLRTLLVNVPGASQTTLLYRSTNAGPADPSFIAADTASLVLGGTFTSRLNATLREEKGYTYGASAGLEIHPTYGVLRGGTSVEASVTGDALSEFLKIVNQFRTGDLSDGEVKRATATAAAQSLDLMSTSSALVATMGGRLDAEQPWETLAGELTQAAMFDQEALNKGATKLTDAEVVVIVVAGDLATVKPQLDGLELGEVTEVQPKV